MRLILSLLRSWVVNAVVLLVVSVVLEDVTDDGLGSLLAAAALFGILNTFVKPVLRLVTLPLAVITLGLIRLPIAMLMLWLTSLFIDGFDIDGFWTLVAATIIVWLANLALDAFEWGVDKRHAESDRVAGVSRA